MKTKLFLSIIISLLSVINCSQTNNNDSKLNLNFEDIQDGKPRGWFIIQEKNYAVSLDSIHVKSGKYSILIESTGDFVNSQQQITFTLPNNYDGKSITLSGYIKTENVTDGYAGLLMRIDPQIAFDNMRQTGITGTTKWEKYEITLPMNPAQTKQIEVGGLLSGKGKMWLDDLHISIDGKDINEAKIHERKIYPAEKDKEFDEGSNIIFPKLNKQKIDNLELLGKIWGFLKYHHPAVAAGNYNWDYELFRMLPEYLKITDNTKRDEFILRWIEKYGEIPKCITCDYIPVDAPFLKPDISWMDKSGMNQKLKVKLKEIYKNRTQGEHYYIQIQTNGGFPTFTNENPYLNMSYPDAGFRLLTLYRYWNMIQYFYPNKYLIDNNWNDVLKAYIPKFISAGAQLEYGLATLELIGKIDDFNATLMGEIEKIDSLRGNCTVPFQAKFIENQLVVTKYYTPELQETAGLKIGD